MYVLKSFKDQQYKKFYIDWNGLHFTDDLAKYAVQLAVNPLGDYITFEEVNKWLLDNNKAVSLLKNSTLGDIFYAANIAYANLYPGMLSTKEQCVEHAVTMINSEHSYEGQTFSHWLADYSELDLDVDWEKYIQQ